MDRTSYDFNAKCFKGTKILPLNDQLRQIFLGGETDQMWLNQLSSLSGIDEYIWHGENYIFLIIDIFSSSSVSKQLFWCAQQFLNWH